MLPRPPYVLLDDARDDGAPARLYADPVEIVAAYAPGDVAAALERVRGARARALHAAGYLGYGAAPGVAAEAVARSAPDGAPLLWFGLFANFRTLAPDAVAALLPDPAGACAAPPVPMVSRADYRTAFARVEEYIRAGDIYQANLTFPAEVRFGGSAEALYARLRAGARAGYGALIATGDAHVLSLSPELFFALEGGVLTARPMKGTARRDADPARDAEAARQLREDPKQRAENLMIVDLMRNDLSRVARAGTVRVPELFVVERYPTVHQMVSTVTGELAPGCDAVDVLAALFPCGSITGAPKRRAMQVISEVESAPRGIYTGAVGRLDADGSAVFNVAIRTLETVAPGRARLGLGSGVVADSTADEEWEECLAKGAFVTAGETAFDLVETMAFDPDRGIALLDSHVARLRASAQALGFAFDRHLVRNELQAATFRLRAPARVRLLLSRSGAIAIGTAPMPAAPAGPVRVAIRPMPVARDDFRLAHKTTRRAFYDDARRASGAFEVLFTDADGFLTEGSFTSIFVDRGGTLVTPPLSRGLLPGVLRAEMIDSGRAVEGDLRPDDLTGGFFLGNSVRGLVSAVTVAEGADARV